MRRTVTVLATVIAISLFTGCTTTQAKEAGQWAAEGLFTMALDIALDGPERRKSQRKNVPGTQWTPCLHPCEAAREAAVDARLEEIQARERRLEAEAFRAEFDAFMESLEAAEQASPDAESVVIIRQ